MHMPGSGYRIPGRARGSGPNCHTDVTLRIAMRLLLVSDLHYTLKQFDWVLHNAGGFDAVVIAGDHLDISSTVDLRAQITVILTYFRRLRTKTRTLVCSGNHDLNARNGFDEQYASWILKSRDLGVPTDEDSLAIGTTLFTICPWWDGPKSCERVAAQLDRDARKPRSRWIWIYHSPPDESPTSWGGRRHFGDAQLVEWIRRYSPDMVMTGHIHQSPFRTGGSWVDRIGDTWVFNPGRQVGPCPTHIVVDTDRERAL